MMRVSLDYSPHTQGSEAPLLGRRLLLAWDCSRSAARALRDAIPLLRQADHCDLLSINARYDDE